MKTVSVLMVLAFLAISLSGCITVGSKEIEIPEQEIRGNLGYLHQPSDVVHGTTESRTQRMLDIEIEIPRFERRTREEPEERDPDQHIWGNQGYIQ